MEKLLYRPSKRQTSQIPYEKNWTWLRKGKIISETESLLIAAQNNANYVKTRGNKIADLDYVVIENKRLDPM